MLGRKLDSYTFDVTIRERTAKLRYDHVALGTKIAALKNDAVADLRLGAEPDYEYRLVIGNEPISDECVSLFEVAARFAPQARTTDRKLDFEVIRVPKRG